MKRRILCLLPLLVLLQAAAAWAGNLAFGPFGDVLLRGREKDPAVVAVLLSDAPGWGETEERMAEAAGQRDALVIGVDLARYFARVEEKGYEPDVSNELQALAKYVEKTLGLPRLSAPLLLGHGAGAGVVYASLVQAPAGTFLGGASLGFRPELPLSHPFGSGRGLVWTRTEDGVSYGAVTAFELDWTVIQAANDPVFPEAATREFLQGMRGTTLRVLPGADAYADAGAWRGAVGDVVAAAAARQTAAAPSGDIAELPLVLVPAEGPASDTLAVFVTGDGGWAGIDKDIAAALAANGIGVIGLDAMKYFWTRRTPDGAGADLAQIMRHYLAAWGKQRVMLIGFSLGADALPPMINNLPPELRQTVRQVTLLAPSKFVELEFKVSDWIHDNEAEQDIALLPEVRRLDPTPLLCVFGQDEESSLCHDLDQKSATVRGLPGSHHFNGDYARVAALILEHLNRP